LQLGLRDKVSAWKALDSTAYAVADWRDVLRRNPQSNSIAPPARTRAAAPKPPSPTKSKK
jgi:hypothetical protein